jgi:hypothetical protein
VYCKQYKVPYRLHNLVENRQSHSHYWTLKNMHLGSPMVCDVSTPEPWRGDRKHNELDKSHITSQSMGDSFYHIYTTPYLFLLTSFFGQRDVGMHNVISKNYHMSDITLISRKTCDNKRPMSHIAHLSNLGHYRNIFFQY